MNNKKTTRNFDILKKLKEVEDLELKKMILDLMKENAQLNKDCKIDPLTGMYNRRIIDNIDSFSVIVMCDIDDFKSINDTYGHLMGDSIIKAVAEILISSTKSSGYVCRLGGDEFAIIFNDCDKTSVKKKIKDIIDKISNNIDLLDTSVTLSAGIAANNGSDDVETVLKAADDALYESKISGKNSVSVYGEDSKLVREF